MPLKERSNNQDIKNTHINFNNFYNSKTNKNYKSYKKENKK